MALVGKSDRRSDLRERGPFGPRGQQRQRAVHADFDQVLVRRHGARLEGNPAAPLTGPAFRARWEDGQHTLDDLFFIVRSLMPNNAPGSLTKTQYADVVAYILKVNGYQAGEAELVPTAAAMKRVTLQSH